MSTYFDSLRQANPRLEGVTDEAFVSLMKRKQPQLRNFGDAAIISLMDMKYAQSVAPIKDAPPEPEWYNTPAIDLTKLIGMKNPADMTTDDFAEMRRMAGVPEENMLANLPINPQGPGSMANIQMAQAYRFASDDQMRMMYGAFYGALESASGLTTPTNVALLAAGGALGKGTQMAYKGGRLALASGLSLGQALMSGVFAAQMGKELPKQWAGVKEAVEMAQDDPSLWGDVGRGLANMVTTGVFTLGAMKGVKHGLDTGRKINAERVINIENGKIQAKQQILDEAVTPGAKLEYASKPVTQDVIDTIEKFNEVSKAPIKDFVVVSKGLIKEITSEKPLFEFEAGFAGKSKKLIENVGIALTEPERVSSDFAAKSKALLDKVNSISEKAVKSLGSKKGSPDAGKLMDELKSASKDTDFLRKSKELAASINFKNGDFLERSKRLSKIIDEAINSATINPGVVNEIKSTIKSMDKVVTGKTSRYMDELNRLIKTVDKSSSSEQHMTLRDIKRLVDTVKPSERVTSEDVRTDFMEMARKQIQNTEYFKALEEASQLPNRIPVSGTHDYVYDQATNKYKLTEIHMPKDNFAALKQVRDRVVRNISSIKADDFHEIMREITDGNVRRMTKEGLELLRQRANYIEPGMTRTEVRDLLATGMHSQPHFDSEVSITNYNKWEDFRSHWSRSGFTTIEGMGRFGDLLRDQAMQYEYAWTSLRDQYKLGVQNAVKRLPHDKTIRHNFMKAVAEANETGIWNDRLSPHREIYEQLESTALRPIKDLAIEMGVEIQDPVTGKKIPFADAVENKKFYFPHKFDRTFAKKFKANYDNMFDKLKNDYGKTDAEAKQILNDIYEQRLGGIREGNIEYARVFDVPGWLGDPNASGFKFNDAVAGLNRYIEGSVRKLMDLRYFEGRGQGEFVLRDQINVIRDPDLRQYVTDMTNQFRGVGDYGKDPQGILHTLRNVQIMRKMNMSAIQNSMQFLIGTLPKYSRLGWRKMIADTYRGMSDIITERMHGVTLDDMASGVGEAIQETYDIVGNSWSSKAASKTLKMNLQSKTEVVQRVFAERMGRKYIKEMVAGLNGRSTPKVNWMLADPIQRKQVIAEMKKYGVSEATINDGIFRNKQISKSHSVNELDYSAHLFSRFTQFRSTALDLPLGWQGSAAKTVLQFKNFSHNQGRMVMNDIVKPFMKNPTTANAKPLLTWLAGSFVSNAATLMIRKTIYDMIAGDATKRDRDTMTAAMEDIISVSPLWFVYSVYLTALYGKTQFGATAQDVDDTLRSIARGQPDKLLKAVLPTPLNKIGGK